MYRCDDLVESITENTQELKIAIDYFKMLVMKNKYSEMTSLTEEAVEVLAKRLGDENKVQMKDRMCATMDLSKNDIFDTFVPRERVP